MYIHILILINININIYILCIILHVYIVLNPCPLFRSLHILLSADTPARATPAGCPWNFSEETEEQRSERSNSDLGSTWAGPFRRKIRKQRSERETREVQNFNLETS